MTTTCAAPDCTRPARARGYCDTHYRRVRKWGDPTIVLKPWGTDHLEDCASHGPDGAVCQKIRGHIGNHGGVDSRGAWRDWLGGDS